MEARFSAPVQTGPGAHPAPCTMCTGSFLGVKSGRGVTLTPHPLLVPWSCKGRAIPLLPLWAVRPVQSLSACTRVTFTFIFQQRLKPTVLNKLKSMTSKFTVLKNLFPPLRRRHQVPRQHRCIATRQQGFTSQRTAIFTLNVIRTLQTSRCLNYYQKAVRSITAS